MDMMCMPGGRDTVMRLSVLRDGSALHLHGVTPKGRIVQFKHDDDTAMVIIEGAMVWSQPMHGKRFSHRRAAQIVSAVQRIQDVVHETLGDWEQTEVVAFTAGSLWFCVDCGVHQVQAEVVHAAQLLDVYGYVCDQCSAVIARHGS